jgi:membrane protease YdiL (CAAX protease family)
MVLGGFFLGGIIGVVVAIVMGEISIELDATQTVTTLGIFISTAFQVAGALAVLAYLTNSKGTGNWTTDFGFTIRLRDWWGIPAGAALQIGAAIVAAPLIRLLFPDGPPEQSLLDITAQTKGVVDSILIILALVVLAPIAEEMIFRGVLLSRLVRSMAVWAAIAVQAAIFGLIHVLGDPGAISALPGLFLIALALGYAAVRTGNLSLSMFLHAGVNLTAALLLLYGGQVLDWLDRMSGVQPTDSLIHIARVLTGVG